MIINNRANRFLFVAGRRLFPGINTIPDAEWPAVKETLGKRLGADVHLVGAKTAKGEDGAQVETGTELHKIPTAEAEALAGSCLSVEILEAWRLREGRDSVRAAISTQLEYLRKPESKPKESE